MDLLSRGNNLTMSFSLLPPCLMGFTSSRKKYFLWSNFLSFSRAVRFLKDCLPYLFHSFRNKYFNKISLGNMLYFQNILYKFWENAWFSDKYAMKDNLQNKM